MTQLNLIELIHCLTDDRRAFSEHCQVLDDFEDYCALITNIQANVCFDAFAQDTHLPSGMAINPQSAAMCVNDYRRTMGFIRAIHAAIEKILNQNTPRSAINLLYAGCGPYATLVLGLMKHYQTHNITFHLLDIHQSALDSTQILLDHFNIPTDRYELICADACAFKPAIKFDLIVSETMQKALEQEPQVTLTHHLSQYLLDDGVLIPQSINVQLALMHWKKELDCSKVNKANLTITNTQTFERIKVGKAISLTKDTAKIWFATKQTSTQLDYLDFGTFHTPKFDSSQHYDIAILTRIQLFEDHYLNEYDSDLTLPTKLHDVSPAKSEAQYHLKYELGSYPRFELESVE